MPERGYTRVPGSARKYRTPSGEVISRREYDNRRLQALGFRNRYELEALRTSRTGRRWGMDIIEQGYRPTWRDWADIRRVKDRRERLAREHPEMSRRKRDQLDAELIKPRGPLARLLARTGRRPISNRPVS